MKSKNPNKNESTEKRFQCENWDTDYFRVNVKSYGRGRSPARKVVTKGIHKLLLGVEHRRITDLLRRGYEVRLEFAGSGQDAIRLFPIMTQDLKHMEVKADTMGSFKTDTLADKKAVFARMGKDVSRAEIEDYDATKKSETPVGKWKPGMGGESEQDYVTPDMMVTCPNCGYNFRVGRKNNKN